MKLNLGCGRDIKEGWLNIDREALDDVLGGLLKTLEERRSFPRNYSLSSSCAFMVYDISHPMPLLDSNSAEEMLMSHIIEHITDPLLLMEELHRIAKPDCLLTVKCPYGSSDDADEDPQHVRRYFPGSFHYFAQPTYWQADYKFRGDWQTEKVVLEIHSRFRDSADSEVMRWVTQYRNIVKQMVVTLRAVKPIRECRKELMEPMDIVFEYV